MNNYEYVDAALDGVRSRNNPIKISELGGLLKDKPKPIDCYSTYFQYKKDFYEHVKSNNSVRGYGGPCYSKYLPIDIDSIDSNDLEKALVYARSLLRHLELTFELDLKVLPIYFSGAKGFHIMIPTDLFGIEPGNKLDEIFKNLVQELLPEGVEVDLKIYDKTRLFRLPNTIHSESGLYKIPLGLDEVFNKSIEEIKELAKKPRYEEFWDDVCELNENLNELYLKVCSERYKTESGGNEKQYKGLINGIVGQGERDSTLMSAAGKFRTMGFDIEDIEQILLTLNNSKCNPPLEDKQVQKIAQSACKYKNNYSNKAFLPENNPPTEVKNISNKDIKSLCTPQIRGRMEEIIANHCNDSTNSQNIEFSDIIKEAEKYLFITPDTKYAFRTATASLISNY